jgi:hypothetical protein
MKILSLPANMQVNAGEMLKYQKSKKESFFRGY